MYWPIKAFLALIVLAVLGGGVYFAWPYLPKFDKETVAENKSDGDGKEIAISTNGQEAAPKQAITPRRSAITGSKYEKNLQLARSLAAKNPVKGRKIIENILKDPDLQELSDAWIEVALALTEVNRRILLTDVPSPEKQTYIVERGDSLVTIARQFNTTADLVAKAHRIDLENPIIRPGQTLRIWKGYWNIKVSKSKYVLLLHDGDDRLVMAYRIGIGKQDRTPEGQFVIVDKVKNPDWYRNGLRIPFGDERNPLGTRWMKLKGTEERTITYEGYGIHGTKDPTSIGKNLSNGCIRMLNEEVEELFSILPRRSTPVVLVP